MQPQFSSPLRAAARPNTRHSSRTSSATSPPAWSACWSSSPPRRRRKRWRAARCARALGLPPKLVVAAGCLPTLATALLACGRQGLAARVRKRCQLLRPCPLACRAATLARSPLSWPPRVQRPEHRPRLRAHPHCLPACPTHPTGDPQVWTYLPVLMEGQQVLKAQQLCVLGDPALQAFHTGCAQEGVAVRCAAGRGLLLLPHGTLPVPAARTAAACRRRRCTPLQRSPLRLLPSLLAPLQPAGPHGQGVGERRGAGGAARREPGHRLTPAQPAARCVAFGWEWEVSSSCVARDGRCGMAICSGGKPALHAFQRC